MKQLKCSLEAWFFVFYGVMMLATVVVILKNANKNSMSSREKQRREFRKIDALENLHIEQKMDLT